MAYRIEPGEPLPDAVRRVAREQLEGAGAALRGRSADAPAAAIHDACRRLRKTRAVLRLVRSELGDEVYARDDERLRGADRMLSGMRDAEVLVSTLDELGERPLRDMAPTPFARLSAALGAERDRLHAAHMEDASNLEDAAGRIEQAVGAVGEWPLRHDGFEVLRPGLKRAYRRGGERFAEAYEDPSPERLHEWRKRVEDLSDHARLLRPVWPEGMSPIVGGANRLGELLASDHDLAILGREVGRHADALGDPAYLAALLKGIDDRRGDLQRSAWSLGARLYADEPQAFVSRIDAWWSAWRGEHPPAEMPSASGADRSARDGGEPDTGRAGDEEDGTRPPRDLVADARGEAAPVRAP